MSRPNINMYSLILLCRQKFSGSKSRFEACFLLPPIFLLLSYYTMHHRYTLYTKKCGTGKFEPEKALWYQTNQPTTPICVLPCSSSEIAEQLQQYCCTPFSCTTHLNATSLLMSCCVCVCVCVCVCAHWVLRFTFPVQLRLYGLIGFFVYFTLPVQSGSMYDSDALCPLKCSGNGRCLAPPKHAQATFMCHCDSGAVSVLQLL
jgi:hypothetical protein